MKLGIIGNGFVGNAIAHAFIPFMEVKVYDKDPDKCSGDGFTQGLAGVVNDSDVVFVCVPTPMTSDGLIDLSIVESVFDDIKRLKHPESQTVFVLKSTVTPGTTRRLTEKYPDINVVFNPEFLTERHARFDFLNQSRIILGSTAGQGSAKVKELYETRFSSNYFIETTYETAEMIKYFNNLFFAVKVSFMNEMKLVADKLLDVDWDKAVEGFVSDGRVGDSHLQVPGPDGRRGFGGSCFPKDINAFMTYADSIGINMNVLKGAWKTNLNVRPEKDWEKLKGRAVSDG
ncbi:MAG: UDP-glucose/GDP-mannose dehydrogenase family protein [Candidatus Peribacter sp.]|jgi:UDPglucose 6-dehydrogenase|nr:UDP-glucose/GDP-mannose dehydrogenase family protein [Candidatus Peribacter sp.]